MSETGTIYRRIKRRETRSSRSGLAITLAVVVILASAYTIAEIVLQLAGQPPLIGSMRDAAQATAGLADYTAGSVVAFGVLAAIIGFVIIVAALTAGRRSRHVLETDKTSAVVDNAVIASALARHAARVGNVSPDSVSVSVSARSAVVTVTPASGVSVDKSAVTTAVQEQLDSYGISPRVRPRVLVTQQGKVGS
ncbi:MAG: hypothetical protein H7146_12285 [Burkholderiaceae bacterium]|nr:hypothetical protein [Microbacteriaceae bacterium]